MPRSYWIFPVFLPNAGCRRLCAFCDQHAVTGQAVPLPKLSQLDALFEKVWVSGKRRPNHRSVRQIAFYGGNFSGLPMSVQKRYLDWAAGKVVAGKVQSIRFSTRPDALGKGERAFLRGYPIRTVEVGLQSLSNAVLMAARRGHTAEDGERAVQDIKAEGWEAGVQLMPGLPGETRESFLKGVSQLCRWGVRFVRLYPAVVLRGTALEREMTLNVFNPLSLDVAVEWCARACEVLEASGIEVIRVGLPASRHLSATVVAGPYHPAFGFLVQSFRFHERLRAKIAALPKAAKEIRISLPPKDLPLLMGDHREAWDALRSAFPERGFTYVTDPRVKDPQIAYG